MGEDEQFLNEENVQRRALLRTYQIRFRILELQAAQQGLQTLPQITIEMGDLQDKIDRIRNELIATTPATRRAARYELRRQALKAYYVQQWIQAEDLLAQLLASDFDDADIASKLKDVQRQLDIQESYQVIYELRDEGLLQPALNALDDLERQQPGFSDPKGLRAWAEEQRQNARQHTISESQPPQSSAIQSSSSTQPTPRQQFQVQDVVDLAIQYNAIDTESGSIKDEQMENVFTTMKEIVQNIPDLDINPFLNDTDSGKKLVAYAYLYKQPNLQFLEKLIQTTKEEKQHFVQHQGIRAIGEIAQQMSRDEVPVWLCEQLNSLLSKLGSKTLRYTELYRIIKFRC
jgi:hypothetical protein